MPMPKKPTDKQMQTALEAAERMYLRGLDAHHLAMSLRYLHARNDRLEALYIHAERMIRFGLAEQELTTLRKLVNELREMDMADNDSWEVDGHSLL